MGLPKEGVGGLLVRYYRESIATVATIIRFRLNDRLILLIHENELPLLRFVWVGVVSLCPFRFKNNIVVAPQAFAVGNGASAS